jgi:hypothetical protein
MKKEAAKHPRRLHMDNTRKAFILLSAAITMGAAVRARKPAGPQLLAGPRPARPAVR